MKLSTHLTYWMLLLGLPAFALCAPTTAWLTGAAWGFLAGLYSIRERDERAWRQQWPDSIRVPAHVKKGGRRVDR